MQVIGDFGTYTVSDILIASGRFGELFACSPGELVYKRYMAPKTHGAEIAQLLRLRDIGRQVLLTERQEGGSTPAASINWPLDVVRHSVSHAVVGVVLPRIPARFYKDSSLDRKLDSLIKPHGSPPKAATRVPVLIRLAEVVAWLDAQSLIHGDLSANNVVWCETPTPGAYLIDCDELKPQHPVPSTGVCTPQWTDPRLTAKRIPAHDQYSDWYALALAMYRGLLLVQGNLERTPTGEWPKPRFTHELDGPLRDLLDRTLGNPFDPHARARPQEWVSGLLNTYLRGVAGYNYKALRALDARADTRRLRPSARVEVRTVIETRAIPHKQKTVDDPTLPRGTQRVQTSGVPGVKTLTYEITLTNGVQTAKRLVDETVTSAPVTELIAIGRKGPRPSSRIPAIVAMVALLFVLGVVALAVTLSNKNSPGNTSAVVTRTLSASEAWQDSGAQVSSGESIEIIASGEWYPFGGNYAVGPEGCTDPSVCSQSPNQPANICCMAHAGLIGRIGDGEPFAVGREVTTHNSGTDGTLYFRINDNVLSDNHGEIEVTVKHLD